MDQGRQVTIVVTELGNQIRVHTCYFRSKHDPMPAAMETQHLDVYFPNFNEQLLSDVCRHLGYEVARVFDNAADPLILGY